MKILEIEVDEKTADYLLCEQAKGKELKVVDGKVVAVEHEVTQEELNQQKISKNMLRLTELTKDFAQVQAGLIIDDIEDRKLEFRTLLNEVRVLRGKEPRNAIDSE